MSTHHNQPLLLLLLSALGCSCALAGGVRSMRVPAVPYASRPIVVDGSFKDWRGTDAVAYTPYSASLETDPSPAVSQLQAHPSSAKVALSYDTDALYVAIEWKGSHPAANSAQPGHEGASTWWKSGDGIELHLLADQTLHIASWPLDGKPVTALRLGDQAEWKQAADAGIASAMVLKPGKNSYTEEIRIPWTLLTASKKAPADGTLKLACDVVWKDLNAGLIQKLPVELHRQSHFTAFFLTAVASLNGATYLSSPNDWGDVTFGTDAVAPNTEKSPLGTSLTSWSIPIARQAPTINGDLKDWSAPFAEVGVLPGLIGPRFGTKLSMQYDAEHLYVAAHFQTSGPLQNVMTEASELGFRGGDALQIRLSNGKGKPVNLCGWLDSTGKPALTSDQGDLANQFLLQHGAQEAFAADADGLGYTQEIAIPWNLICPDQAPPKTGDRWKVTFQPWWSGMDPRFTFTGDAKLAKRGAIDVAYDLPADGEVTLGVYDGQKLLNTVLKSEFRAKGKNTENWDGLDQWGTPVASGSYQIKGLYHPRITTDHVMSFGNPGNPSWPTPDNKGDWLSDEQAPQAAATDGKWVFLAAPGCEKGYAIIAVDENGQRQWGTQEPFYPRTVSLAVEGDYLYALYSGPELTDASKRYYPGGANAANRAILICLDKRTGKAAKFTLESPHLKIASWPYTGVTTGLWELRSKMSFSPDTYSGQPRYYCDDIGETTNALGIAAFNHKLYVAMHDDNKILVLSADTGEKLDEIPLSKPAGLHALAGNELLAVSDKQVVKVDTVSKRAVPVVKAGLSAPRCVTTDKQNRVYVSDWGSSFQVKVFTPGGVPLRTIGKQGGRPWLGAWDNSGMLVPTGIAVTEAGQLWVAEDDASPKRISVWNAETGGFMKEYLGPAPYGGGGVLIDPKDPSVAYTQGLRLKLDWAAKTWTPQAVVGRRMEANQPFALQGHSTFGSGKLVHHGDHEYLIQCNSGQTVVYQRTGDLFQPVAAQGVRPVDQIRDGAQKLIWDSDLGYHIVADWFPEFFKEHLGENYTWTDLNGDHMVQPEEMQWVKAQGRGGDFAKGSQMEVQGYWGGGIGEDWSIYWPGGCRDARGVYRLDIKGWTPAGAPIYDIKDSVLILQRDRKGSIYSIYPGSEGKVFVNYSWEDNKSGPLIECIDRDGKPLWSIPIAKEQGPKDILCENVLAELTIPGLGKVLGTWEWHGNFLPYLLTTDGLYVSSLLEEGQRLGPQAAWDESFKAYYQDPKGVPYLINGANDAHHLLKINGLEGGRFEASLKLTDKDVARAAKMSELPVAKAAPKPILAVASANHPPAIDGNLDDWNLRSGVKLEGAKGRSARVALSRDAENLYLAYEVNKENPLSNKGGDWQTLFITGDCVDLMLAANPKAEPHRAAAVEGDQRLLISVYQGKPIAVLYRPAVPGATKTVQLMAARIDEIKRFDSAKISIQNKGNSYAVEAAIPLKELGLDPKEIGTLQGDVGVIFSDETGGNRSQRLYYYNKKTTMTADLTTEATLQPGEWGAIQFPLGPNLLKNGGFNDGFATHREEGWMLEGEKNGGHARIAPDGPRSGAQSLILEQTAPVVFPSENFNLPDYRAFIQSANLGQGGGSVSVVQSLPVTAGHYYSLRINYRTLGLKEEVKKPDPNRGYSAFVADLAWVRPGYTVKDNLGYFRAIDEKRDSNDWSQLTNSRWNDWSVAKPYQAPEGTTSVIIGLRLFTLAANDLPKVYVDDVELVDVTE